ncbi:hypothetical protein AB9P05_23955 [Roseivirga sp. BDSF3-8]|uniref:hypothetical protein n=1 Tax=Roseivirga sp. BDSF3-8 TaxID=3241598 RepID=UPI00353184C4
MASARQIQSAFLALIMGIMIMHNVVPHHHHKVTGESHAHGHEQKAHSHDHDHHHHHGHSQDESAGDHQPDPQKECDSDKGHLIPLFAEGYSHTGAFHLQYGTPIAYGKQVKDAAGQSQSMAGSPFSIDYTIGKEPSPPGYTALFPPSLYYPDAPPLRGPPALACA